MARNADRVVDEDTVADDVEVTPADDAPVAVTEAAPATPAATSTAGPATPAAGPEAVSAAVSAGDTASTEGDSGTADGVPSEATNEADDAEQPVTGESGAEGASDAPGGSE